MTPRTHTSKWRLVVAPHILVGSIVALPWLWLCQRYWDYYPLWDAAIYYECALNAAKATLDPRSFSCAGHPTMGYLWLPGALTRYFGPSYRVFLVYNAVLAWLMSMAIADMASRLLRGKSRGFELLLVIGSVMYCPIVVSSILQLSPDFGALVFLTLAARSFTREHLIRAFGWGILAGLSKESGALLFAVELGVYVVVYALRAPNLASRKVRAVMRRSLLVLLPLAGLAALAGSLSNGSSLRWMQQLDIQGVIRQFTTVSFMDNVLPASLGTIFVLNCMWIPALLLLVHLGCWFARKLLLALPSHAPRDPAFEFMVALFVLELFLLTRFRTFTNVRYYAPIFPWILLLAARSLLALGLPRVLRFLGQSVIFLAVGLSNFRSFDPVSAELFGTMRFGKHRLFRITSLTNECCGLGRDQLVYNLEFAELDDLLREVLPFVLASRDHAIAVHPESDWKLFDSVDPRTHQRATPRPGSFKLAYTHTWAVGAAAVKPVKIYYIAMPNMPDRAELARYSAWYDFQWRVHQFDHGGYTMGVYELTLKH
jgi:hypothetical protein